VLARGGRAEAALAEYREALRLQPERAGPMAGLALILASSPKAELRNGAEAVGLAERASELSGRRDPQVLSALDQAYAEAGRFAEAIQTAQQVQALATTLKQPLLGEQAAHRLEFYRAGKPWREETRLDGHGP
jgi:tetratricopeptide (TPR) repeat protein